MAAKPTALVIIDGFGYSADTAYNAIAHAQKPTLDYLFSHYPHTLLQASGSAVGLPPGFIGNSEVGHTTLGAGRIVPSSFLLLKQSIEKGDFFSNPVLTENLSFLAQTDNILHILGLLSDAGVQNHQELLYALIQAGITKRIKKIVIHAFLDGRDTPPQSAPEYLSQLETYLRIHPQVCIGSITGRYYAIDRDQQWDRTLKAYHMLTTKNERMFTSWQQAIAHYYGQNITDEFIPPTPLAHAPITDNDGVIFANFREDRARQLTKCFLDNSPVLSFFISSIRYSPSFTNPVLIEHTPVTNTLKEVLSAAGKTIFSIAETEKYAHITYFFSNGYEYPYPGETQILIPSHGVKKYSSDPAMSAQQITDAVLASLKTKPCDFYLINYANADMVGHAGDLPATTKAIECLDTQIKQLYDEIVIKMGGTLCITADHGNAEIQFDQKTGQPHTAHTTNPVPFVWAKNGPSETKANLSLRGLADVAPFILGQMGLQIPEEMKKH